MSVLYNFKQTSLCMYLIHLSLLTFRASVKPLQILYSEMSADRGPGSFAARYAIS